MKSWVVDIECLDGEGNPSSLHFSSSRYIDPNGKDYKPRIKEPGLYQAGLFSGEWLPSNRSGFGETTLVNKDNALSYMVDYAFDGRLLKLYFYDGESLNLVLEGVMSRVSFTADEVSIKLRDPSEIIQTTHPNNTYAGDNVLPDGVEGVEDDIKGSTKPRVFGSVKNVSPVLVNTARLVYQVSDIDCNITTVRDEGVIITIEEEVADLNTLMLSTPSAGACKTYQGYFKLGDAPSGTITADANSGLSGAGDVFNLILSEIGESLNSSDISSANSVGDVGMFMDDETDTSEFLDSIAESIGGYWRVRADSSIELGVIPTPSTPVATFYDWNITEITRSSSGSGGNGLPIHRVEVRADRNYTTQNRLAGSADIEFVARAAKEWRTATQENAATKSRHPLSEEYRFESVLDSLTSADNIALNILNKVSVRRDNVEVSLSLSRNPNLSILDTVRIESRYLGYENGRNFLVVGYTLDAALNQLQLQLWG